jgi:hypothetical protein
MIIARREMRRVLAACDCFVGDKVGVVDGTFASCVKVGAVFEDATVTGGMKVEE